MRDGSPLSPGFSDAPVEAAASFRAILTAMAEPGRIVPLEPRLHQPAPLGATMAAALLTLVDNDTTLFLDQSLSSPEALAWLRFHTGVRLVEDMGTAGFVCLGAGSESPPLDRLAIGTAEYPDRSATLLLAVDGFESGRGVRLDGPGIKGERRLAIRPEPAGLFAALARNHALYPLGYDTLLCGRAAVAGLPRSTRISIDGGA